MANLLEKVEWASWRWSFENAQKYVKLKSHKSTAIEEMAWKLEADN